jgi:tungstate transport system ATP-binding protein
MTSSLSYALEARDLVAGLGGRNTVDIPSLQVRANEVLMVIGPNGSGKTTLLLCLAFLLKPVSGTLSYGGISSHSFSPVKLRRKLAVVFQEPFLLNRSVLENVVLGIRLRGENSSRANERAGKWLARFGVAHLARRQARMLSGGEAKRVSLARALALEPEILLLDEPFSALDSPTRQSLLEDFQSVLRETKVTTVMVTHDHNEALALGDRIAVLIGGRIRQLDTPDVVFSSPADEEVAHFIEGGNVLHGVVDVQSNGLALVKVGGRELQVVSNLSDGCNVVVFLQYADVTLSLPTATPVVSSARNQLRGKIVRVFPQGPQLKVTCDCGFLLSSLITRRSWEEMGLALGSEVVASFKASAVHLLRAV